MKNKYPIPIVDELLDELAGTKWFSKIDFAQGTIKSVWSQKMSTRQRSERTKASMNLE
jgi:hypothetical protein